MQDKPPPEETRLGESAVGMGGGGWTLRMCGGGAGKWRQRRGQPSPGRVLTNAQGAGRGGRVPLQQGLPSFCHTPSEGGSSSRGAPVPACLRKLRPGPTWSPESIPAPAMLPGPSSLWALQTHLGHTAPQTLKSLPHSQSLSHTSGMESNGDAHAQAQPTQGTRSGQSGPLVGVGECGSRVPWPRPRRPVAGLLQTPGNSTHIHCAASPGSFPGHLVPNPLRRASH